jgi:hypothetical protein
MKGGADHIEDVIRAGHPDTCTLDTHKSEIRVKSTVSDGIKSKNTFVSSVLETPYIALSSL